MLVIDAAPEAPRDCRRCPRLAAYRDETAATQPGWFNGAVPSFGDPAAGLLVVGLAPGVRGANRTGRPFTGDFAGDLLYATLTRHGFANGAFDARPDDGLRLSDCLVTNAVRCVPPQNKPTTAEIAACRPFLAARIAATPHLRAIVALGRIAHDSVLRALGTKAKDAPFAHGARARLGGVTLFSSYHCSRYNTNTRRLTPEMFDSVFAAVRRELDAARG
ncbi:MAG: uracil-DNA glycosylase [Alphaproteobacteria bacterium HGW-Alphaproteobacteria-8]|nr:MAG: uracil-DNA glycosylase [Alphaproteobacteria bacterium HGW-Alphaproteobacteria-8]